MQKGMENFVVMNLIHQKFNLEIKNSLHCFKLTLSHLNQFQLSFTELHFMTFKLI